MTALKAPPRFCERCGGPVRIDNVTGICSGNPDCRKAQRLRRWHSLGSPAREHEAKLALARRRERADDPEFFARAQMFSNARQRARKRGIEFTITLEDVPAIPAVCPDLGIELSWAEANPKYRDNTPSLDRILPDLGYVPGNVRVISYRANRIKNDATPGELLLIAFGTLKAMDAATARE